MTMPRSTSLDALSLDQSAMGLPSIRTLAARRGVDFGMAVKTTNMGIPLVEQECGILVPENEMQASKTQPNPGSFDWQYLDQIANFAAAKGMKLRGHTFIYHVLGVTPAWMQTAIAANWQDVLNTRIAALAPRYKWASVDVCNEVVANFGANSTASGFREDSIWYQAAGGTAFVQAAYQAARSYCAPGTRLAYCDFGAEVSTYSDSDAKRAKLLSFLDGLANAGLIDDFSAQAHITGAAFTQSSIEPTWRSFLASVRGMGLRVNLSELDFLSQSARGSESLDYYASERVKRVVNTWAENIQPGEQLLCWGVRDDLSWLQGSEYNGGYLQRPLPWDMNGKPKWMERTLREIFA